MGAGGYGKSALASQMMDAAKGFDAKLWANFEAPVEFSTFALWLLKKLMGEEKYERVRELYQTEPPEKLMEVAIAQLQSGRYLLVLDNLETVQRDDLWQPFQDFLEKWLGDGKSTSKILLTTQTKVALSRAEVWKWLRLCGLETSQGIQLLLDFGIEGNEAELREFVEIAEGHPLLLRCAASSLILKSQENYEVAAIYRLKRDDLTLLQEICGAHRGDPTASVGKVLDRSFSYLEPMLQGLLLRLSVLRGSFGLTIAQALIDEPLKLEHLRKLARSSFVQEQRLGEEWQFEFLPLVKRYLAQRLRKEDQEREAHERAIVYFAANIKPSAETIADCAEEIEIFHHRCELGQYALADQIMDTCVNFLERRGYYRSLLVIYEQLTREWNTQISTKTTERKDLSIAWARLGDIHGVLAQYQVAINCHLTSLEIQREIGDRNGEGGSLCNLGLIYDSLGNFHRAVDLYQQSLEVIREVGNRQFEANTLGNLGNTYRSLALYQEAIKFQQRSLEIKREIGDRDGEGGSLCNLGLTYASLGEHRKAVDLYEQSLEVIREVGNRQFEANTLGNLGGVYDSLEEYELAIDFYNKSLEIEREIGHRSGEASSLDGLANAYNSLEQYHLAIALYEKALEIEREIEDRNGESASLCNLANVYESLEEYQKAISCYHNSLEISREVGNRQFEANALWGLGVTHDSLEQYTQAIDFYQQSSEIARDIGDYRGEVDLLFKKGQSLAKCEPRRLEALATIQQVRAIYTELKLDYMVEKCNKAIHDFKQSIATKSRDRRIKICLWFGVGVAIVLLIAWLRK